MRTPLIGAGRVLPGLVLGLGLLVPAAPAVASSAGTVPAPFVIDRPDAPGVRGWRPVAPVGDGRWLLSPPADAAVPAGGAVAVPTGARRVDLADLVDADLRAFLADGLAGRTTGAAGLVLIPRERTRPARREVAAMVRARGGTPDLVESDSLLMLAELDAGGLATLLASGAVIWAEPRRERGTDDSFVREFGGANAIETIEGFTGSGVVVEVVDKGLFTDHTDLLASAPLLRTVNDGPTDHGTPTYGIVFGNGLTQSAARGMMPGQSGLFSSYLAIDDRDAHLAALANDHGGSIQSNSWGSGITRRYNAVSAELDEAIRAHRVLVFQSQSNRGDQDSRPEAWAKNAVSVGGVNGFATLDRSDDTWSGGASTGPAIDGRIKPDLVLFNDGILTTSDQGENEHVAFTGTSAATPAVAGHAGVMYEMWRAGLFHGGDPGAVPGPTPSTAMARALLINGAVPYAFDHAADDLGRFRQGWGTPDLLTLWADAPTTWVADEQTPLRSGEGWARVFDVAAGEDRLAVTLSWTEPAAMPFAARTLVNDLDLRVISPSGVVYHGNHGLHDGTNSEPGGTPDDTNPLENVFIASPEAGRWQVEVAARSVQIDAWGPTPEIDAAFALVASGVDPTRSSARSIRVEGGIPVSLDPVSETVLEFDTRGVAATGTGEVRIEWDGGAAGLPLEALGDGRYRVTMSGFECGADYRYRVQLPTFAGLVSLPADPDGWLHARAVRETAARPARAGAWATDASDALISGAWVRGTPAGGGLRLDPPFDADGDGLCWLTDNRAGDSGVAGGAVTLTSPPIDISGLESPSVRYDLWLASDRAGAAGEDTLLIELSEDAGATWTELARERSTFRWAPRAHPIEPRDAGVLVRFTVADDGDASLVEAAIDDLRVTGAACPPCGGGQGGGISGVDLDAIEGFVDGVLNHSRAADINGDGVVDIGDIVRFVDDIAGGCGG